MSDGWLLGVPTLRELDDFAVSRRLRIHKEKSMGIRASHLELVAAYKVQLKVISAILAGRRAAKHAAMVHVATGPPPIMEEPD